MASFPRKPLKAGDVYPAHVLRDEYGMNAENRPTIRVDVQEVPDNLQQLIPYVERWAIPCDVTRGDYFDKQPEDDVKQLYTFALPFVDAIHAWLDTQPEDVAQWPEAAVHYMYFLKAHDEAYQPTEEELKLRAERHAEWEHNRRRKSAIADAELAFREKEYGRVVELLGPFEHELEKILNSKLKIARKKSV